MCDEYQEQIRKRLADLPISNPPLPWKLLATFAVGGLTEIGYAPDSDALLVVSSQGRGLFDCLSARRIARDREEMWDGLDQVHLRSPGIGDLASVDFRLAGLHGGGLPRTTSDGWGLDVVPLPWPHHFVFLTRPWKSIVDEAESVIKIAEDGACEFRACGFSDTGYSFVIASSCDVSIYCRT